MVRLRCRTAVQEVPRVTIDLMRRGTGTMTERNDALKGGS